jgi:hypothetical protein
MPNQMDVSLAVMNVIRMMSSWLLFSGSGGQSEAMKCNCLNNDLCDLPNGRQACLPTGVPIAIGRRAYLMVHAVAA